jgi:uncharacterized membrane protein
MSFIFSLFAFIVCGLFGSVIYMAPTILAVIRKKKNIMAIAAVNLFLGWTLIVWGGLLFWVILSRNDEERTRRNAVINHFSGGDDKTP